MVGLHISANQSAVRPVAGSALHRLATEVADRRHVSAVSRNMGLRDRDVDDFGRLLQFAAGHSWIIAILILLALVRCDRRPAEVIEIPHDYRGWVEVRYVRSCAPARIVDGGRHLIRISPAGKACVGSPWTEGVADDEYYFVDGATRMRVTRETPGAGMIWGRYTEQTTVPASEPIIERFYVGTEEEYRRATLSNPANHR